MSVCMYLCATSICLGTSKCYYSVVVAAISNVLICKGKNSSYVIIRKFLSSRSHKIKNKKNIQYRKIRDKRESKMKFNKIK